MKKTLLLWGMVLSVVFLLGFNKTQTSITGKIVPADQAEIVFAIGTDTVKAIPVMGTFSLQVKPGMYRLFVNAKDPYKDFQMDNLEVKEGQTLDVGEIVLQP